jgi:hypothetical protein
MKLKVTVAVAALVIVIAAAVGAASKSASGTGDLGLATRISPLEMMLRSGPTLPLHDVRDVI